MCSSVLYRKLPFVNGLKLDINNFIPFVNGLKLDVNNFIHQLNCKNSSKCTTIGNLIILLLKLGIMMICKLTQPILLEIGTIEVSPTTKQTKHKKNAIQPQKAQPQTNAVALPRVLVEVPLVVHERAKGAKVRRFPKRRPEREGEASQQTRSRFVNS